jgi:hypothetical protein
LNFRSTSAEFPAASKFGFHTKDAISDYINFVINLIEKIHAILRDNEAEMSE